jgi:hypothetical protein
MHADKFSPRALHEAKGPPAADGDMVHPFVRQCGWLRDIPQPRFPIDLDVTVQLGSAFRLGHLTTPGFLEGGWRAIPAPKTGPMVLDVGELPFALLSWYPVFYGQVNI